MIQIRPVSDLRNKFPEIEKAVGGGDPVYLTKNGYGAMVVLSQGLQTVWKLHWMKPISLLQKMKQDIHTKKFLEIFGGK